MVDQFSNLQFQKSLKSYEPQHFILRTNAINSLAINISTSYQVVLFIMNTVFIMFISA